jgi:microcystin-dependent protein
MPVYGGDTPVGAGMLWYTNTAPANWLLCDGSSLNRADYPELFNAIGITYGSTSGTTFNLPDLRQRFPLGKAASGTGNSLGDTGGAVDHTHTVPAHYHGMGTGADLSVSNSPSGYSAWGGSSTTTAPQGTTADGSYADSTISGRIGLVTGGVDGNAEMTSGANNPPFLTVNYIIKYA